MDLFQAGVAIDMPELHMYICSPTRNMHLYVVMEKCHVICDVNTEMAGYIKHSSSLCMLPSLDTCT